MEAKIKKVCKKCSPESIKVYIRTIRRLYKLVDDGKVPDSVSWLAKEELEKKYKKLSLNKRRHLSISAVKLSQAFGNKKLEEKWSKHMYSDSEAYNKQRNLNKVTDVEREKWPSGGYAALKKASTEFKRRISKVFKTEPSLKNLYLYTKYVILRFYASVAMRNDLASFTLKKSGDTSNYLTRAKAQYTVHMRSFKTKKFVGETEITFDKNVSKVIFAYIKYRNKLDIKHDFLLSNQKGQPLSKSALGKILALLTSDLLSKKISTRIIRVLKATAHKKQIDEMRNLAKEMQHSLKTQGQYTRKVKDDGD